VRGSTAEPIEIDDVTDAEARERIVALFRESSGSLFYDDIAERLRLPLRQTVEICNRLEMDGLIGEPATK
jgi:Mn-dependent DtxR family transcriptional regulator